MTEVVLIPEKLKDQRSFRRWAQSADYPEHGWITYLRGKVWVDMSMERNVHNLIKTEIGAALVLLARQRQLGRYWSDNMLFTNTTAQLSTEPDGMFATWKALQDGRVKLLGGDDRTATEVFGSPEMVLEVVSPSSVRKDTSELPSAYLRAGIAEYWLIDPRSSSLRFDILRATASGYRRVRVVDGWRKSRVFGAEFRIVESTDPLGGTA